MRVADARALLQHRVVEARRRTLRVSAVGHTFHLPAERSRVTVELQPALDRALAVSRRGWLGSRVQRELSKTRTQASIPVRVRYASGVVPALVARIAKAAHRDPVDASVQPVATGLSEKASHDGRELDAPPLRSAVVA